LMPNEQLLAAADQYPREQGRRCTMHPRTLLSFVHD
jgi:hypothetical protein